MTEPLPTLLPLSLVHGAERPDPDDLAELFHEASKLHPSLRRRQAAGIIRLGADAALQAVSNGRSSRCNAQRPALPLPTAKLDPGLARGRSPESFAGLPLRLETLAALLHAGYGFSEDGRRTVPSGGALYPLELYAVARRVAGLAPGVHHYDPRRHALELVRPGPVGAELDAIATVDGLLREASALVIVTAVFWGTRFKYGLRGYRFALLEAGHCVQNMLLAAHPRGVAALPLGGCYDGLAEQLVGADGVDEAAVYALALGGDP